MRGCIPRKMKRVGATIILGLLAVGGLSGCFTIGWMATKAGTKAVADQESPGQGPVLRAVEGGARKTNEAMQTVDKAKSDALHKVKEAVTD